MSLPRTKPVDLYTLPDRELIALTASTQTWSELMKHGVPRRGDSLSIPERSRLTLERTPHQLRLYFSDQEYCAYANIDLKHSLFTELLWDLDGISSVNFDHRFNEIGDALIFGQIAKDCPNEEVVSFVGQALLSGAPPGCRENLQSLSSYLPAARWCKTPSLGVGDENQNPAGPCRLPGVGGRLSSPLVCHASAASAAQLEAPR